MTFSFCIFLPWSLVWLAAGHDPTKSTHGPPVFLHSAEHCFHGLALYALILVALYHLGNMSRHFEDTMEQGILYWVTAVLSPGAYRGIQQALASCGTRCMPVLTSAGLRAMNGAGWVTVVVALALMASIGAHHAMEARSRGRYFAVKYAGCFGLGVFCVGVMAGVGPHWGHQQFHLHHYMWASLLAAFAVFNTPCSRCVQAILIGVVTQEISFRGVSPFFEHHITEDGSMSDDGSF